MTCSAKSSIWLPRHRALVEEPGEPFELALAADPLQRVELGLDLVDRPGERASLDRRLGRRQHDFGRIFGGVLWHRERLKNPVPPK